MKNIITFTLLFLINNAYCQKIDTLYYGVDHKISTKDSSFYLRIIKFDSTINRYKFQEWSKIDNSSSSFKEGELLSINPEIKDGRFTEIDDFENKLVYLYKNNVFVDIIDYRNENDSSIRPIYSFWMIESEDNVNLVNLISTEVNKRIKQIKNVTEVLLDNYLFISLVIEIDGAASNIKLFENINSEVEQNIVNEIKSGVYSPLKFNGNKVNTNIVLLITLSQ